MALTRLTNLIASRTGRMLYVNPDDFNASDLISNNGNSPTRPFKTIQRALLEVARFSYIQGQNNDKYDQFTINLSPGEYIIDNRPGKANTAEVPELSDQSNFDILDPANDLVKFNSTLGGLVVPRGTSLVGMDLRKTRVRPRYVPNPADDSIARTSIFKVTGACYFWQFSLFDALPTSDVSGNGGVYSTPNSNAIVNSDYSHHKVTCFTYSDQSDLDLFYSKASKAFASIPTTPGELESRTQENRIVGPLQQSGQKEISTASVSGALVTIVTNGAHEVFEGQQITIEDVSGNYSDLNGTYFVTKVNNDSELVITKNGLTPGNIPATPDLANAIVKAEIDTVDSSSPYIFNCSLRSTYGLCGLWADGSRVSGFKSMVVAQFTGVSLQKDDRAFVKFTETTSPHPSFVLEGGASDSVALHQDSTRGVYYRGDASTGWRHYHIRVSNNAFIQSVSVFAVGYAEQHLIESGGDYSITNSNSNFGTQALIADGFRPDAFTLDKKGHFTHIVPPQALSTIESDVQYYPVDVQKSKAGLSPNSTGTKIFLFEQRDPSKTPAFDLNNYKLGGKTNDKLYVKLTDPNDNNRVSPKEAVIDPNGIEEHEITNVDVDTDLFTTAGTNNFETGTPIRIYSSTSYLPLGMESNRLYFAIKISNTSFKIAPSEEDARAGAGGDPNSIVNIRSIKALGSALTVKAYISDTNPELPRFDIDVNSSNDAFSTGDFPHGFTTGDKVFFRRRVIADQPTSGTLPQIQQSGTVQSISLTTEYFVSVVDSYTFTISDTESNANNNIKIPVDAPGDSNQIVVYRNVQKSPLRYDPVQENWYVSVKSDSVNTIHPILTNPNAIYSEPLLTNTENAFFRRISDDRQLADRTYRLRYVIPKSELNARPPIVGYVIARRADANNQIIPYNTNSNTNQTSEFDRIYFIYRSDTVLRHIPNEQDGVYYLTILLADIAPTGDQFNSTTDTFGFLKYSQDVSKIYPDLDKDNPEADPPAAVSVADNLVHGEVYQDDNRSSLTKEAIAAFVADAGYTPALNALSGKATSGQENRLIAFNSTVPQIDIELRRTSQVRAGNQTFEYTGFGSGNYSTGFPSKQEIVLSDREVLFSQSQRRRAGVVFYSGLNAYGDLYVGNQKINAITGEVEILDKPILRVAGTALAVNAEFVPYVQGTKNVNIEGNLNTQGGAGNNLPNNFNNSSKFTEGIFVSTNDQTNRAIISHDICLRQKQSTVEGTFNNYTAKQIQYAGSNLKPTGGTEGEFPGDIVYKPKINRTSRHEGYIYVGKDPAETNTVPSDPAGNGDYRQIGLIGVGHLTSIEESYTDASNQSGITPEPYIVTGKFGINQTTPTESLHVGTGDVLFDNNLTVTGDVAINGGDLTTSGSTFNYTTTATDVNFATGATTLKFGASNSSDFAAATANGGGPSNGTSTAILNSDNLKIYGDVELTGKFVSGTSGSKVATVSTTAETTNFLTIPNTVNFSAATMNTFTGATNINIGNTTGTTTINHNLTVTGDLRVNGTTTYVNSTIVDLDDPIISLGGTTDAGGAPASAANNDRGIELKYYYNGAARSGFMGLNVSAQRYELFTDASGFTNNLVTGTFADLKLNDLLATGSLDVSGNVDVDGTVHASTFELDSLPDFTSMGNEFDSNFRAAIMKHALPEGAVIMWAGTTVPNGYAWCSGATYTAKNGSAIVSPDLRGRVPLGAASGAQAPNIGGTTIQTTPLQVGGTYINETGDASNANTLAVNMSAFVIDQHTLTQAEIPAHTHGMLHGHSNMDIDSFSYSSNNFIAAGDTSGTSGDGHHSHNISGLQHKHYFGGDDHLKNATFGNDWNGSYDQQRSGYDWESSSDNEGNMRLYKTGNPIGGNWNPTVSGNGGHTHLVSVNTGLIFNELNGGKVSGGTGTLTGPVDNGRTTGNGATKGLGNGGHSHTTSGTVTLDNRSHSHNVYSIQPWCAMLFLMKL